MRLPFGTPRERLVVISTAMLVGGLLVLSAIAVATLAGVVRGSLDTRLTITAEALEALTDYGKHNLHLDADDLRQFNNTLTMQVNGAVFDRDGKPLVSSASTIPADIAALVSQQSATPAFWTLGRDSNQARVYVRPVVHRQKRFGTIVVWRPNDSLHEIQAAVLLTLGGAIIALGVLGMVIINRVSRQALDDAIERQRRFTADASHDLRTPLSVIRAEADLALENGCPAIECSHAFRSIHREADRMTALIDDMLAIARAENGSRRQGKIDLSAMCETLCRRLQPLSAETHVKLACRVEDTLCVRGDEASLACALAAVVQNAIKYAPRDGNVSVRLRAVGDRAEFSVADTGTGFSQDALAHACERFWRDDAVRSRGAGSGLGLAIAKSVIAAHAGYIELRNRPGGGAEVRCLLPLDRPPEPHFLSTN